MAQRNSPASRIHALASGPLARNVGSCSVPNSQVTVFMGHTGGVIKCAWNPRRDILASASCDSTVRLWNFFQRRSTRNRPNHIMLTTSRSSRRLAGREVTSLDWNHDGTRLVASSFTGVSHLWDSSGLLERTFRKHRNTIFATKWNKIGTRFLTASADRTVKMWHANTGLLSQKFSFHTAPVVDVDWLFDLTFASCSKDGNIHVCELGRNRPLQSFRGHRDNVNAVRWDPPGKLLASCSDDESIRLWSMDSVEWVRMLNGHTEEVNTIDWRPTGLHLASASLDHTVRLWDVETGACTRNLTVHSNRVNSVAFSHDGRFLASGSTDKSVQIWSVESGVLMQSYKSTSSIYDVSWNHNNTLLGACSSDGSVIVIDLRY